MAITIGNEYKYIDLKSGNNTVRHPLEDEVAREAAENNIAVQDTQPVSEYNKLWMLETMPEGVQVPTMDEFSDLRSAINKTYYTVLGDNLVNPETKVIGSINASGGVDSSSTSYLTSDFIEIEENTDYILTCWRSSDWVYRSTRKYVALYDASKQFISGSYQNVNSVSSITFNTSSAKYARVSWQDPYVGFLKKGSTFPTAFVPYTETYYTNLIVKNYKDDTIPLQALSAESKGAIAFIASKNLFVYADSSSGMLQKADGGIDTTTTGYTTSAFMPIKNGYTYTISPRCRRICFYSSNSVETFIACDDANVNNPYTFVSQYNGYMRFSIGDSYASNATCIESYTGTATKKLEEGVSLSNFQKEEVKDLSANTSSLRGKKWCACGDSFTQGDFTGLQESEYKLQSGKYIGKNAVYPYIIGDRCDMEVTNLAVGGMTMCCIDGTRQNSFTYNEYYKQIPADSDYITFKFGINDNNYSSPVGTIDNYEPDPEDTEEEAAQKIANAIQTFYGAWNVVLYWVTEHFPTAKIGIIITNGITDNAGQVYLEATRNICKKWGIAYIDEVADETVPLLLRVKRTGLSDTVYNRKLETFRVSETNLHPNVACHYYESTFIEAWLKSL